MKELFSFYLSSATDRFPLSFQKAVVERLFNPVVAHAWVESGLHVNIFQAPNSSAGDFRFVQFKTGQPQGFLSSWPLFTLCHHILVWLSAEAVYPGKRFRSYALLAIRAMT